ncbi:hypothetical protein NUV89_26570, partial [Pseudomonas sp. 18.1.10]|uniref:hypothetical protein n=1 Tax=Pseudomonas sp. 18.1.10 TaxID=2969302 RepID=UPI00214FA40C
SDSGVSVSDVLTDTPLSQASQLPHLFCGVQKICFHIAHHFVTERPSMAQSHVDTTNIPRDKTPP